LNKNNERILENALPNESCRVPVWNSRKRSRTLINSNNGQPTTTTAKKTVGTVPIERERERERELYNTMAS
jgi:hypothetical protein